MEEDCVEKRAKGRSDQVGRDGLASAVVHTWGLTKRRWFSASILDSMGLINQGKNGARGIWDDG